MQFLVCNGLDQVMIVNWCSHHNVDLQLKTLRKVPFKIGFHIAGHEEEVKGKVEAI